MLLVFSRCLSNQAAGFFLPAGAYKQQNRFQFCFPANSLLLYSRRHKKQDRPIKACPAEMTLSAKLKNSA